MSVQTFDVDSKGRVSIKKDPNAILDYSWDWTTWLDALPDTINTATVTGDGVTVASTMTVGKIVTAFISGGAVGETAIVTCRVITTGGRQEDRRIYLNIVER